MEVLLLVIKKTVKIERIYAGEVRMNFFMKIRETLVEAVKTINYIINKRTRFK